MKLQSALKMMFYVYEFMVVKSVNNIHYFRKAPADVIKKEVYIVVKTDGEPEENEIVEE